MRTRTLVSRPPEYARTILGRAAMVTPFQTGCGSAVRDAGRRGCEDGVVAGEGAEALRQAGIVDAERQGRGHPRPGADHHQGAVLGQGEDGVAQLGQLRGGGGVHRLELVDRALRAGDAEDTQLGQVTGKGGLGGLDALDRELLGQLLLRGDPARTKQLADLLVAAVLGGLFARDSHARIQEPTPLSVKSSPMMECGTRPSSRWMFGTPEASTRSMLLALAFIPPEMVPSSISALRSAAVSWPTSSPALRIPGT